MNKYIESDFYRWTGKEFSSSGNRRLKKIPQYKLVYRKRKRDQYKDGNKLLYLIASWRYKRLKIKYNSDIPAGTEIGYGFVVEHLGAITINKKAKIGNNVNIYNGVTIGKEKRGERVGNPTIGNQVWIGANAIVVGKINIGDNVMIAPGAFVNFDVPNNSIVVGNPGKIIPNENACEKYIENIFAK